MVLSVPLESLPLLSGADDSVSLSWALRFLQRSTVQYNRVEYSSVQFTTTGRLNLQLKILLSYGPCRRGSSLLPFPGLDGTVVNESGQHFTSRTQVPQSTTESTTVRGTVSVIETKDFLYG